MWHIQYFTRHYADPVTYNSKKYYDKNNNFAHDFKKLNLN